mmetsp:Transcript_43950/g.71229  ORF Transcript_43950/g.71229 Transcript_43950/m.71229 type:complete len:320 (+) Transcript_43950:81-1040(+)
MQSGYPQSEANGYGAAYQPGYGGYQDTYAANKSPFGRSQRKTVNLAALAMCLLLPWLLFTAVFTVHALTMQYDDKDLVQVIDMAAVAWVVLLGYSAFQNWRREDGQPLWYIFLFASSALALFLAITLGNVNYVTNTVPFLDAGNMNDYMNVSPKEYKGNQLMDAGRIHFSADAKLDLTKSMGFKNLDTYCVVPITVGSTAGGPEQLENYDFWAIGTNCCSGHVADFHCGEYNNVAAHAGLRLMKDEMRSYFRLAVQQAEAAYNIKANHPIFLYWMQDPQTEIIAYHSAAHANWLLGVFVALAVQLLLVVLATVAFAKLG